MPDPNFNEVIGQQSNQGMIRLITDLNQLKTLEAPPHSVMVSPDGTVDPAVSVDNNGDVTLAGNLIITGDLSGVGNLTLADCIIHTGDPDTKICFADDEIEFTAGGLSMLKLTETTQDLITLGPGSGDVDINFNGDMFLRGSDGFFGVGVATPRNQVDILNNAGPQLRLTHTDNSVYATLAVDASHDLTIKPTSTGQIKLQPTTDSTDFFQVLDADGGAPVFNVDVTNEAVSIRSADTQYTFQGTVTQAQLSVQDADVANVRAIVLSRQSDTAGRGSQAAFLRARAGGAAVQAGDTVGLFNFEAHDGTDYNLAAQFGAEIEGSVAANTVPMSFFIKTSPNNSGGNVERLRVLPGGNVGISESSPQYKLHVTGGAGSLPSIPTGNGIFVQNNVNTTDNVRLTLIGGAAANSIIDFGDASSANVGQFVYNHSADEMRFTVGGSGNRLVITAAANIGVGVASPSAKIDLGAGDIEFTEMTAPGAGGANTTRLYAEDDGGGTTQQKVVFSSGNTVIIAKDGGLQTYTPTNVTTDRSFDADSTTLAEIADVLGTLINDFQTAGILG